MKKISLLLPFILVLFIFKGNTQSSPKIDLPLLDMSSIARLPSNDDVVFDNGNSTFGGGYRMGELIEADDFELSSNMSLTGAIIDWIENKDYPWDGTIEWFIYTDNLGQPGSLIASGLGNEISTMETASNSRTNYYSTEFDFDNPVPVLGGTRYWLGLHWHSTCDTNRGISWAASDGGQFNINYFDYYCNGSFTRGGFQLAFKLLAEPSAPIPTISQWGIIALSMIMLIVGVVALKYSKRFRLQGKQ